MNCEPAPVQVWTRTVLDLPVADVLHRVVVAPLRAGVELLQPLRGSSRRKFGARLGRDAARHRIPHSHTDAMTAR